MSNFRRVLAVIVLAVLPALAIYWLDPVSTRFCPVCPFHEMTGLWCPGCGTTRALHQLLHGNLAAAFRFNPLAIFLLPVMGYLVVLNEENAPKPIWVWTVVGVVIVFGVLRNIPVYPFTLLAP